MYEGDSYERAINKYLVLLSMLVYWEIWKEMNTWFLQCCNTSGEDQRGGSNVVLTTSVKALSNVIKQQD
jgi:hypothetical protein